VLLKLTATEKQGHDEVEAAIHTTTGTHCNFSRYNRRVLRRLAALLGAMVLLAACGQNIKSKEKVQEAILNRLKTNSGLNLETLDVTTTAVSFEKNIAHATVAFHPKNDSRVNSGMVMTYTLENRGGKWAVVKVGDSHGRSLSGEEPRGAEQLPPGHPPVESMDQPPVSDPHGAARAQ
jgi:hypothetical protein